MLHQFSAWSRSRQLARCVRFATLAPLYPISYNPIIYYTVWHRYRATRPHSNGEQGTRLGLQSVTTWGQWNDYLTCAYFAGSGAKNRGKRWQTRKTDKSRLTIWKCAEAQCKSSKIPESLAERVTLNLFLLLVALSQGTTLSLYPCKPPRLIDQTSITQSSATISNALRRMMHVPVPKQF